MTTTSPNASSTFTCASCRVIFTSVEEQRVHYQSEWHRYNLRRKVADRPPVTEQAYLLKVQTASDNQSATLEAQQEASKSRECLACRKTFASAAAYENHLNSKKHIENSGKYSATEKVVRIIEPSAGNTAPTKSSSLETEIALPENATDADIDAAIEKHMATSKSRLEVSDCLYCPCRFDTMEACIDHMHLNHSFYIPDIDYLKDLPGLMRHLADKVSVWHVCLSCGSESRQPFPSLESVRRHMLDKGHNKIRYDEEGSAELADFFDYTALKKGCSVSVAADSAEAAELDDFVTDDEDGEFEYDEGYDENALILAPDESELILPNGARLGARAYRRYYRQNLMPYLDQESRPNALRAINAPRPDGTVVRGQHYVPPPKVLTEIEKRGIKQEHYDRKNFALKMGIKGNGLQTHYREQLLQ